MSICPKNRSSRARRDKRRANWKMSAPTLVKCSKCGALMMPHRVCKACGSYNKKEIIAADIDEKLSWHFFCVIGNSYYTKSAPHRMRPCVKRKSCLRNCARRENSAFAESFSVIEKFPIWGTLV